MQRPGKNIVDEALAEFLNMVGWRRELHAHPELSFEEFRTSDYIAGVLAENGIACEKVAGTGVLARITGEGIAGDGVNTVNLRGGSNPEGGASDSPVKRAVVLRADIDALPVGEDTGLEFASLNKGVMHACGHDMHTAILLGAMVVLNRHRKEFSGTVFGLFQPGEELNPGGASLVLKEDLFRGYDIVAFVGEHVEPLMETGRFGFRAGQYMAASDELRFTVTGTGGHAAMRDKLKDPVQAAAEFVTALHRLRQAAEDAGRRTVISVGRFIAEGATNVVPGTVYLEGTMRTVDEGWRAELKGLIRSEALSLGEAYGVDIAVDISDGYPAVYNSPELTEKVKNAAESLWGNDAVEELGLRNTSDDFGFYSRLYPSVYYRLGVGGSGAFFSEARAGKVHTPTFMPDEKALGYGVAQFVNIVYTLLGN